MMNKKLLKEQIEITTKNKELKQHLSMYIIFYPENRATIGNRNAYTNSKKKLN